MRQTLPTEELGLVPQRDPEGTLRLHLLLLIPCHPRLPWVGPRLQRKEVRQMGDTPHGLVVCDS